MKTRKILSIFGLILIAFILIATPVLAVAKYTMDFGTINSSATTYTYVPMKVDYDVDWLVSQNYMLPTGRDTSVYGSPRMLTHDGIYFVAEELPANKTTTWAFSTGNTETDLAIIPGYGGYITTPYNVTLEPGGHGPPIANNNFKLEIEGYIDTSLVDYDILNKNLGSPLLGDELRIYVWPEYRICVDLVDNGDPIQLLANSDIDPGIHKIKVTYNQNPLVSLPSNFWAFLLGTQPVFANGFCAYYHLYIDDVLADTTGTSSDLGMDDNENDWVWGSDAVPFFNYIYLEVGSELTPVLLYQPADIIDEVGLPLTGVLPDREGTEDGVITWGTFGESGVSVSAGPLEPITQAKAGGIGTGTAGEILTDIPTLPGAMYSDLEGLDKIPGAGAINEALDVSETPHVLWWYTVIFLGIEIASLVVYGLTTTSVIRTNSGMELVGRQQYGSLFIMVVVVEVLLASFGVMRIIPFFVVFLTTPPSVAILLLSSPKTSIG